VTAFRYVTPCSSVDMCRRHRQGQVTKYILPTYTAYNAEARSLNTCNHGRKNHNSHIYIYIYMCVCVCVCVCVHSLGGPLTAETAVRFQASPCMICVTKSGIGTRFQVHSQNCEERLLASSCLSVCPSAWNNAAPTARIFMKLGTWGFFKNLSKTLNFD
jgi:hypothetical protein